MVGRRLSRAGLVSLFLLSLFLANAAADPAPAAPRTGHAKRNAAEEEEYARDLTSVDPRLVDAFHAATTAMDAGHMDEALLGEISARRTPR